MESQDCARRWMKLVPSVKETDPLTEPILRLKEHGVAVLTNAKGVPIGILTLADLDAVSERAAKLAQGPAEHAAALFECRGQDMVRSVKDTEPVASIAGKLAVWQFKSGVPVVNEEGAYQGYIHVDDLTKAAKMDVRERQQQISRKIGHLKASFPNEWASIQRQIPIDFKEPPEW